MADLVGLMGPIGIVLAGLVLVVLLVLAVNFLLWQLYFRKGVLVEGRIGHYTDTRTVTAGKRVGETYTFYALQYTYFWNDTSYMRTREVSKGTYDQVKDGDSVKVWLIPEHPTWVRIEDNSAFLTLMRKYGKSVTSKDG